jgi:hypothetical protein
MSHYCDEFQNAHFVSLATALYAKQSSVNDRALLPDMLSMDGKSSKHVGADEAEQSFTESFDSV